jgi:threonine/homoserine/homoserine lactone efflux protein
MSIVGFAMAMLILAASPGPGVFATVARALASGLAPALAVIGGIVLGDIVYLSFAIFGLAAVAHLLGDLFVIVKIAGGAYLIWVGYGIWRSSASAVSLAGDGSGQARLGNFLTGLLITLANPKVILFYIGLLPTFLDLASLTPVDIATATFIVATVLTTVLVGYAVLAVRARRLFTNGRALRSLNRSAGGVMMLAGIIVATR